MLTPSRQSGSKVSWMALSSAGPSPLSATAWSFSLDSCERGLPRNSSVSITRFVWALRDFYARFGINVDAQQAERIEGLLDGFEQRGSVALVRNGLELFFGFLRKRTAEEFERLDYPLRLGPERLRLDICNERQVRAARKHRQREDRNTDDHAMESRLHGIFLG